MMNKVVRKQRKRGAKNDDEERNQTETRREYLTGSGLLVLMMMMMPREREVLQNLHRRRPKAPLHTPSTRTTPRPRHLHLRLLRRLHNDDRDPRRHIHSVHIHRVLIMILDGVLRLELGHALELLGGGVGEVEVGGGEGGARAA